MVRLQGLSHPRVPWHRLLLIALGRWQRIAPADAGGGLPARAEGVVTLPPGRLLVAELCTPRGVEW